MLHNSILRLMNWTEIIIISLPPTHQKNSFENIHLQNVILLLYTLILMTVTNKTDFFFFFAFLSEQILKSV